MAETLETGDILAPVRPPRPAPTIALLLRFASELLRVMRPSLIQR